MGVFLKIIPRAETRYVTGIYFQRFLILTLVTITIVVALDISVNFQSVMSLDSEYAGFDGFARLAYYAMLRLSFVTPSILMFSGVWGLIWAEYSLSTSRERIMIFSCGRSYVRCLIPALLLGVVVSVSHFSIVSFIKPKTIELESLTTHRVYGPKFKRPTLTENVWISGDNFIVNARIEYTDTVGLSDVQLYRLGLNGAVEQVISAERARPTGSEHLWQFENVTRVFFGKSPGEGQAGGKVLSKQRDGKVEIELKLDPDWIENFRVAPSHLPHSVLAELANQAEGVPDVYKYKMALYERYATVFYCIATILLSAYVALSKFSSDMLPYRALAVASIGYGAYFLYSNFLMFGHFGYLPVHVATWGIPVFTSSILIALIVSDHQKFKTTPEEVGRVPTSSIA